MASRNRLRVWLLLTVTVAACSSPPGPRETPHETPTPSISTTTAPGDDENELPSPPPTSAAAAVAAGFAAAWVNTTADTASWWASIRPWCDDGLAAALRGTDPANVPARQVTGPPVQTGGSAAEGLRFQVPTDTGTLLLTLAAVGGGWRVSEVDFTRNAS